MTTFELLSVARCEAAVLSATVKKAEHFLLKRRDTGKQ
jgi:hypothetical protein